MAETLKLWFAHRGRAIFGRADRHRVTGAETYHAKRGITEHPTYATPPGRTAAEIGITAHG